MEWEQSNRANRAREAATTPTTKGYQPGQWAATNGAIRAACLPRNSSSGWLRSIGQIPIDVAVHLPDRGSYVFQRRLLVHAVDQRRP